MSAGFLTPFDEFDTGAGAPPGHDGEDGLGIVSIEQPFGPSTVVIGLSNGSNVTLSMPQGLPGNPGITPIFLGGSVTLMPAGTPPSLTFRPTERPDIYTVDLVMPDPGASVIAAKAEADRAEDERIAATAQADRAEDEADAAAASAAQAVQQVTLAAAQVDLAEEQVALATQRASAAAGSATDAASSATAAAASLDEFGDIYLGRKPSDPTTDNDGNSLQIGALYFNTTTNRVRIHSGGGVWETAYAQITGGVTSFKGREGNVTPQDGDYAATQIAGLSARSLFRSLIY